MLQKVSYFSGVEVVTYCLMPNHFHLLVRVNAGAGVSDSELVDRYRKLYPKPSPYQPLSAERLAEILKKGGGEAERIRKTLKARMNNISEFMKTLKQRFTAWYNSNHTRFGPLWSDRFKSVLVEGSRYAVETVAAYIDLNPVRAGMVNDPKDYRYSGYGRASHGEQFERSGIGAQSRTDSTSLAGYRRILLGETVADSGLGEADQSVDQGGGGGGRVDFQRPSSRSLLSSIVHFTNGKIFGSRKFVERIFDEVIIFREVVTRRRSPVMISSLDGLYSGTSVRRSKSCK